MWSIRDKMIGTNMIDNNLYFVQICNYLCRLTWTDFCLTVIFTVYSVSTHTANLKFENSIKLIIKNIFLEMPDGQPFLTGG